MIEHERFDPEAPLLLDERDIELVRTRHAPQPLPNNASVAIDVCAGCAAPVWRSTTDDGQNKTIARIGDRGCDACESFRRRHPEVYEFVIVNGSAQAWIRRRMQKKVSP